MVLFSTFLSNPENQFDRGKYRLKLPFERVKMTRTPKLYGLNAVFCETPLLTMRTRLLVPFLTLLVACQSRPSKEQTEGQTTTATATPDTLCYRQILSRDTTMLRLVINGNKATGYLDNNPYEKDRAQGTLQGTVNGSAIQADWQRSGEGVTQSYTLDLTMNGDSISWYEGERVEQQGKWQLKDPTNGYRYTLGKIDCPDASVR